MSAPDAKSAWPLRLDLLARLEALIEGLGQAARMIAASLLLASLCFLRATPPALIARGVAQRRLLPPLLFLLLACFPLPEIERSFARAMLARDANRALDQRFEQLQSIGAWDVFVAAGPAFVTIWLAAALLARLMAAWLRRPLAPLRTSLIYLGALVAAYGSLATLILYYVIAVPAATLELHPGLRPWIGAGSGIALAVYAIPVLLALGMGCYLARRLRHRFRKWPRGRRWLAGFAVALAPLTLAGLVALAASDASRIVRGIGAAIYPGAGGWLDAGHDKLRRILWVEASHCEVAGDQMQCWLAITSVARGELSLVEPVGLSLIHGSGAALRTEPIAKSQWRPAIGAGAVLVLPEVRAGLLGLQFALTQLCPSLNAEGKASDWRLRFELRGVVLPRDTIGNAAFETYRGGFALPAAAVETARSACAR